MSETPTNLMLFKQLEMDPMADTICGFRAISGLRLGYPSGSPDFETDPFYLSVCETFLNVSPK